MTPTTIARTGLLILALVASRAVVRADDWPQWRGPQRDGISREAGWATSWPADGPKLLWQTSGLGAGFSTPSIAAGVLYVMGNRDGEEQVLALDLKSQGKLLWAAAIGPVRHEGAGYPGPRSSPTIDGDRVYALGLNGDLVCLDARNGDVVWRHDFVAEFGGEIPTWGYSESPLVDGPWVVCSPGGSQATLAAFNKADGRQAWGTEFGQGAAYASIVPAVFDGVKQYVQFLRDGVVGVDAQNGALLWRYDAPANGTANCSTPLVGAGKVFAASGYGTGGGAADIVREDTGFRAEQAFFSDRMKNHHGGMVLVDGYVYGSDDPGILTCLELATGETKWQERVPGKCSLVFNDGRMITRSERGKVCLVNVSPRGAEIVGEFEQPERSDSPSWPHPVVVDGRLYLRDQDKLLVYDVGR